MGQDDFIKIAELELKLAIHEAFRLGACWSSDRRLGRYESTHLQQHYDKKLAELVDRIKQNQPKK